MEKRELPSLLSQRSIFGLTLDELGREMAPLSITHAYSLWRSLYRKPAASHEVSPPLRRWKAEHIDEEQSFSSSMPEIVSDIASQDGLTRKYLLRLADGNTIETVLMGYPGRSTACLSTQVGCAMGCVFCATGQMGFTRHLTAGEIVTQVLHGRRVIGETGLRNLVLMGMGEPLHNYDAVMTALENISDTRGLNIGPSRITISTVGVVPGILRLAGERRPYHLAVSLHGATEEDRGRLVPISKRWPLKELMRACRTYGAATGKRIFFEWTLIAGINDSPEQAANLAALLHGIDAHVNLIPLNSTSGFEGAAAGGTASSEFQRVLQTAGIPSTVRQRRGIDVAAGCGQLRAAA